MTSRNFRLVKIIFSLWIVFHLSVVVIMSNGASYFAKSMGSIYQYYSNQLNMNTNWNFFSPDPAQVMYIRYIVYFLNDFGEETQPSLELFYPKEKNQGSFGLLNRRHFYLSRYMLLSEDRLENMFTPWVCRIHEGATHVAIQTVAEKITPLEEIGTNSNLKIANSEEVIVFKKEFQCAQKD
ncbi:MAG: hypothetical protein ACK5P5_09700 [Pseudobdellovibrionaceae bacterium]